MQIKEMFVDPTTATKWLEGNTHNRLLRQSVVDKYARDMRAGKWRLTHECIAFDPTGKLIDGQHRLWAVIESGVPCRFMVAFGVPQEALAVINSGLVRTNRDHLKLGHGIVISPKEEAIVKRLLGKNKGAVTSDEVKDSLERYGAAVAFAVKAFPHPVRGITVVPVYTPVARAFFTADHSLLLRFGEAMCDGRINPNEPREEAILTLRNWLLTGLSGPKNNLSKGSNDLIYAKVERALYAYLHEERLGILYSASREMFPLPDEPVTTAVLQKKTVVVKAKRGEPTPTKGKAAAAMKSRKVKVA